MHPRILSTLCLATALASVAYGQPGSLVNSNVASSTVLAANGRWYVAVGGSTNTFIRSFDPATKLFTPIPLVVETFSAGIPLKSGGDFELLGGWEAGGGVSNGDSDTSDDVLVLRRRSTGVMMPVPMAIEVGYSAIAKDASVAGVVVSESGQNADLDGDGSKSGLVLLAVDPPTGTWSVVSKVPTTLLYFGTIHALNGGELLFPYHESLAGQDLNGDGDALDMVYRIRRANGAVQTIPVAVFTSTALRVAADEQTFVLSVAEAGHGVDLTADGDVVDVAVSMLVDRTTLAVTNSGLPSCCGSNLSATHLFVTTRESDISQDSNGDGDQSDIVPWLVELTTGSKTMIPTTVSASGTYTMGTDFVVYERLENAAAPFVDWNGDGDTFDLVPVVYEISTGTVLPLSIALQPGFLLSARSTAAGDQLLFLGHEPSNAFTDYNHDGDGSDLTLFAFDLPTRRLRSYAMSAARLAIQSNGHERLGFVVNESAEGAKDLNGDLQVGDDVAMIVDVARGTLFDTQLAQYSIGLSLGTAPSSIDGVSLVVVNENQQSADLNGNGSKIDYVPFFHAPLDTGCGAFAPYGEGCATSQNRIPEFDMHGCAYPGGSVRVEITRGIVGQVAFLLFGHSPGNAALPGDCSLLVAPMLPVAAGPYFLSSDGLLGGTAFFSATLAPNAVPGTLYIQAFLGDPLLSKGYAASQGLALTVSP